MHTVVISHSFPTSKTIDFIFVDQLCRQFANKGEKITIIALNRSQSVFLEEFLFLRKNQ